MARTRYFVLTNGVQAADYARKERAMAEADAYVKVATEKSMAATVQIVTSGGKIVFDWEFVTPKAPAVAPQAKAQRPAQGASTAAGWDLLYDKPRQGAEVARRHAEGKTQYALVCKATGHVHPLPNLVAERAARKAADWCPTSGCAH